MLCIYCLKDFEDLSDEHIFPDSIGGSFVIRNVCKRCNGHLGQTIDPLLTNHYLVQLDRATKGIEGKSGKIPNPFYEGTSEGDCATRLILNEDGQYEPHIVTTVIEDSDQVVQITVDKNDIDKVPDIIKKKFCRKKLTISDSKIQEVIDHADSSTSSSVAYIVEFDTENYKKALIKIAYEVGVYWLGDSFIDDPIANEMRTLLLDPNKGLLQAKIQFQIGLKTEINNTVLSLPKLDEKHCAIIINCDGKIAIMLKVFDVFQATIIISNRAELYSQVGHGRIICLNPRTRTYIETSFLEFIK